MGYWNETCPLTRLPICEGDRVKVVIATVSEADDGHRIFNPLFFPISGEYDGYGSIENICIDSLTKAAILSHNGFFDCNHNAMLFTGENALEEFLECIRDGRLFAKKMIGQFTSEEKYERVKMYMYHEKVYNSVVEKVKKIAPEGETKPYEEILRKDESLMLSIRKNRIKPEGEDDEPNFYVDIPHIERYRRMNAYKSILEKDDSLAEKWQENFLSFYYFCIGIALGRCEFDGSRAEFGSQSADCPIRF